MKKNININFWEYEKEKPKILHSRLIEFIENRGFSRVELDGNNCLIVRKINNIISAVSDAEIVRLIRQHLEKIKKRDVFEVFAKGLGSYISRKKLELLNNIELIDDRDDINSSTMYFQNQFCLITKEELVPLEYKELPNVIWKNRIINRNFTMQGAHIEGQFEVFCKKLTGSDVRLEALMSIMGYLLHRNKDNGETTAIILYDENMGIDGQANGGTGKTLISQAISKCRELVEFNGKEIKTGSWFKNQRIDITTDIITYDDLNKDTSLELFFPMLTTGVEVEKKRQQSFFIPFQQSPKILITSNYPVHGPGGSSDERRRHEFEILNYYDVDFTPEIDFGNRFFENHWSDKEWDAFYFFMMKCIQVYLNKGLIKVDPINLKKAKIEGKSCKYFVEFAIANIKYNIWQDKRKFHQSFKGQYEGLDDLSSKKITNWIKAYAISKGGRYEDKSTGGSYLFTIKMDEDEKQ